MVALVGPSGAGKSTLLHIAGLLERPDAGRDRDRRHARLQAARRAAHGDAAPQAIGFVYQYHHLLPEFSALENVVLPQMIAGVEPQVGSERARAAGRRGLGESGDIGRRSCRAASSSGSPSRARSPTRPTLLLADEPTGNLDPHTADHVFDLLINAGPRDGNGALVATHNLDLAGAWTASCAWRTAGVEALAM